MVVIADESKLVPRLGKFPLPVEVVEFGHKSTAARLAEALAALGYANVPMTLRQKDGAPFKTDSGNVIYDCAFGAIQNAPKLAAAHLRRAGRGRAWLVRRHRHHASDRRTRRRSAKSIDQRA